MSLFYKKLYYIHNFKKNVMKVVISFRIEARREKLYENLFGRML